MVQSGLRHGVTLVTRNEEGVAIIAALLILMLLTFIGITATNTTTNEKKMVRSKTVFDRVFSFSESGAMEGVQIVVDEVDKGSRPLSGNTTGQTSGLLIPANSREPENYLKNTDGNPPNPYGNNNGRIDKGDFTGCTNCVSEIDPNNNTFRLVAQLPIQSGDSLALGGSRVYSYASYGYSENWGGRAIVEVRFRKRF